MNAKDAAFIVLFVLFTISIIGSAALFLYYVGSGQKEEDLRQKIANLEAEKGTIQLKYEGEMSELEELKDVEEENEDLRKEIEKLEKEIERLKEQLTSQSGTSMSCEVLVDSLRTRIYELEGENEKLHNDLQECENRYYYYPCDPYCPGHPCGSCGSCPCDPCDCHHLPCHDSVSVSNGPGIFNGHPYDAVIYVYFTCHPCYVLRIYITVLSGDTIQIVGVDWD